MALRRLSPHPDGQIADALLAQMENDYRRTVELSEVRLWTQHAAFLKEMTPSQSERVSLFFASLPPSQRRPPAGTAGGVDLPGGATLAGERERRGQCVRSLGLIAGPDPAGASAAAAVGTEGPVGVKGSGLTAPTKAWPEAEEEEAEEEQHRDEVAGAGYASLPDPPEPPRPLSPGECSGVGPAWVLLRSR